MTEESQSRVAPSNKDDPNFDPTRNPSDVESEHEPDRDVVSLDALSQEELQYIVGNSTYRDILSDLLAPFVDGLSETESVVSADHTATDSQSQESTNPVVYKLANRQGEGADTSSSQARKKALKRPSEGEPSPSKKRRRIQAEVTRKRKSGTGAPVPPAKKPKVSQQSSSASESEDESFDPTLEREDKDDFKVKVPRTVEKYIDKHFRRSLSKEERTAMLKRHPKPDVEAALPPKLDSFVADFAGRKLDKARDSQLAKIQGAMLYAAGPLTSLWADLIEQGLANDSDAAIHVSDILETIQRSLVLLGNANSPISETRREIALESIHPSLKKYGKGEFAGAKADLFGQEFKDTLVKKVEADSALSKAVSIVSKSSGSSSKIYQKPTGNRFFGSRTSRYGAASGKVYQPYHRFQGKENRPPTSLTSRRAVCSTDSEHTSQTGTNPTASRTSEKSATGWEAKIFCTGVERPHTRSMGSGNYSRLQNSLSGAASNQADPFVCLLGKGEDSTRSRDTKTAGEGGDKPNRSHGWLREQCVPSSKEGGQMEVDTQPEGPKHIHSMRAFQDGGHTFREGSPGQRRLHVQTRLERCIPVSANYCSTSEVPPISMAGSDIPIQCPTLWASNCTSCIHKAPEACPSSSQSHGPENSGLFGRYSVNRKEQDRGRERLPSGEAAVGGPRLCDQSGEITIRSNPMHRVFGIHGQRCLNDIHIADCKSERDKEQMQASSTAGEIVDTPFGSYHRCLGVNRPCNPSSPPALSRSPSTKDRRTSPPPLIRVGGNTAEAEYTGFEMVDQQSGSHQWETNSLGVTGDDNRIGCLEYRLGSLLEQPEDGGHWSYQESQLHINAKELLAAFLGLQTFVGNREGIHVLLRIDSLLHQSDGWYPLQEADGDHNTNLELEPGQENFPVSGASSRHFECRCRSRITQEAGQLRMEAGPIDIPTNHADSGPLPSGSFCLQDISATSKVHELEARPRSNSHRCPESALDKHEGLCLSPFRVVRQMPIQDSEGGSQGDNTHCTSMANAAMVCSSPVDAISETTSSSEAATPSNKSQGRQSPTDTSVESSRVANIRDSLNHQGISSQATTLILSSWRKSTEEAYSCSWRKWEQWCTSFGHNSIHAPISAILDFLACQFAEGKQYRTINSYRSAISMTHNPIDGVVVGKHPLVTKGIFNRRPPQPRYASTWDVGRVLEHIRSLGRNTDLSLKQLSQKLVVLLALSNASRASEIHALDIRYLSRTESGVTFTITKLTKTAQPGKKKVVHYLPLKQENRLCPIAALEEYLKRTSPLRRNDKAKTQLLLSVMKPFHPVSKSTIARWMKVLIQEAGVGQQFSAHSIRGAASTAAVMKGMSLSEVLHIADWSSDNVFKTFYFKPTDTRPQSFLNTIAD